MDFASSRNFLEANQRQTSDFAVRYLPLSGQRWASLFLYHRFHPFSVFLLSYTGEV